MILDEIEAGQVVSGFTAKFKLRISEGSGEPADGFSFNFANDLPIGNTTPAAAENGGGTGFSFCVDNYRFSPYPGGGNANSSGIKIRYGGADVAGLARPTWNYARWIPVVVTVKSDGTATIIIDNETVMKDVALPNYAPSAGRFGFYARTGGQNEMHGIDDLSLSLLTSETAQGGYAILAGGNAQYTPAADFTGQDKFYYLLTDGQEGLSLGEVTVNVTAGGGNPPVITAQPQGATLAVGGSVTLSVTATGSGLAYQWTKDGTDLSGANSTTLALNNVTAANAGSYRVKVSNADGTVTSDPAVVRVLVPAAFAGVGIQGGNIAATVQTVAGLEYKVQFATELKSTGTVWTDVPGGTFTGDGSVVPVSAPIGAGNMFFRIIVQYSAGTCGLV
jgi:hypothetical protein